MGRDAIRHALGNEDGAFVEPYLLYTRATADDLRGLVGGSVIASLRAAERRCGPKRLRAIVGELGWSRFVLGLEVRRCVAVSIDGSLPFVLDETEAALVESCGGSRREWQAWLAVGHGVQPTADEPCDRPGPRDPVGRFRDYNLAHADLLARLLAPGPLTRERTLAILDRTRHLVDEFVGLFGGTGEDAGTPSHVFAELERAVLAELERGNDSEAASPELTRLVLAFEDPPTCGRANSLHGLKRWLHQRGLSLGFKLVRGRAAARRTVDLLLLRPAAAPLAIRRLRYADLEPFDEDRSPGLGLPYPVALAVDGFARQALFGRESFPNLDIFCYGAEVHYFLTFWNHPAFLRVDFDPPLRGGMVDLGFYGVSNYEIDVHPSPALDALQSVLRALGFDVSVDTTRVQARFDKERALDAEQLRDAAESVLCLAPSLMDLDWTIGSLALDERSRRRVIEAWTRRFLLWGALPFSWMLTSDRLGILQGVESGPRGQRETAWSGQPPYRDRFGPEPEESGLAPLFQRLDRLGVEVPLSPGTDRGRPIGQLTLERRALRPLRATLDRRARVGGPGAGTRLTPEHEADRFAAIIARGGEDLAAAARLARLVPTLERSIRFLTTGAVNGRAVQRARLPLRGATFGLFVLRDERGIARLAAYTDGPTLWRRSGDAEPGGGSTARTDCGGLIGLLRRGSYLLAGDEATIGGEDEAPDDLRRVLAAESAQSIPAPLPGERSINGVEASPGRAVGPARLAARGRPVGEFEGAILVGETIGPEDSACLWRSAGVVATGGGALGHAGLIAMQFGKPSLIVRGRWSLASGGQRRLLLEIAEYRIEERAVQGQRVEVRRGIAAREQEVCEGDLLAVDASRGRLEVLGQAPATVALHREFHALRAATERLAAATDPAEQLVQRGRRIRARGALERSLRHIADPMVLRYAVHELLLGGRTQVGAGSDVDAAERAALLAAALDNPHAGPVAAAHMHWAVDSLRRRLESVAARAVIRVPRCDDLFEILWFRAETRAVRATLASATRALELCGLTVALPTAPSRTDVDAACEQRLRRLDARAIRELARLATPGDDPSLRHRLQRAERIAGVLGRAPGETAGKIRRRLERSEEIRRRSVVSRSTLAPGETDVALHALVGWKAARLAEIERLCPEARVPPWFVVTDRAFREALDCTVDRLAPGAEPLPEGALTLGDAIAATLAREGSSDETGARLIHGLWERLRLPRRLVDEIAARYEALGDAMVASDGAASPPFVAVRSSSVEEDAETAARAGEFDTFLFVRGADEVVAHVKRAWAGLWTARAIHNRAVLGGARMQTGGGVVIQHIVAARASGVLQTVNVARGEPAEIVVNAGLGLGEGVVRGIVAVDAVTVAKDVAGKDGPLRFGCVTGEKTHKVVYNRAAGRGTMLVEARGHERLRPALDYAELSELVRVALRLERAYGHPLDLEFGVDEGRLWILQVRPVPAWLALLRDADRSWPEAPKEEGPR